MHYWSQALLAIGVVGKDWIVLRGMRILARGIGLLNHWFAPEEKRRFKLGNAQ